MSSRTHDRWVDDDADAATSAGWRRVSDGLLERLMSRPSFGIGAARLVILATIATIGLVDYVSGIRISLSVFYLIPIALAVSWFGWKEGIGAVVISLVLRVGGDYLSVGDASLPLWSWWNTLAALTIMLVVVWTLNALLSLRRQLERRIEERTARLVEASKTRERLEHELEMIGARERNAFGQELHDDVCQHLVGTALAAKVHTRNLAALGSPLAAEAQALVGWLEEGAQKTRRLARGLLMAEIDPDELPEQLEQLVDDAKTTGVACHVRKAGDVRLADGVVAAHVFRIVQEALRNALKHAAASRIDISMTGDEQSIQFVVDDDGRGMEAWSWSTPGMGLRIMAHRAGAIGGQFSIEPAASRGTRIVLRIPRAQPATPP